MLQIDVALPNGHVEVLSLLPSGTVGMLRTKAELALGKKRLKLVTAKNRVLVDENKTLEEAEIQHGDCVTDALVTLMTPVVTRMIRKPPTISRQWSHKLDISFGANRDARIECHFCMSLRTAKVLNAHLVRSSMA